MLLMVQRHHPRPLLLPLSHFPHPKRHVDEIDSTDRGRRERVCGPHPRPSIQLECLHFECPSVNDSDALHE